MTKSSVTPKERSRGRRTLGHAQDDHILDPYQRQRKLHEPTWCPQCTAVYQQGRWHWAQKPADAHETLCPACQRIHDQLPAGVVTLSGVFALDHKDEIIGLARHQEEAEKREHPLNRIMAIEEHDGAIVIKTTDIHLPRRIGAAQKRAFHGQLDVHFDENGYFARVDWQHES
jgi:hypothetical protein